MIRRVLGKEGLSYSFHSVSLGKIYVWYEMPVDKGWEAEYPTLRHFDFFSGFLLFVRSLLLSPRILFLLLQLNYSVSR